MSLESEWLDGKELALSQLNELLGIGLSPELAIRLANWNATYEYNTFNDMQTIGLPATTGPTAALKLLFSRSEARVNPGGLEGAVLDAGKLYAIFIPDVPELNILDITFKLNGTPVHQEFSPPWDYAGTNGGGDANRVTFVAGLYSVQAVANATGGFHSFEAAFTVE